MFQTPPFVLNRSRCALWFRQHSIYYVSGWVSNIVNLKYLYDREFRDASCIHMLARIALWVMGVSTQLDPVSDIAKMLRAFARCEMYSVIDRLANATSKEAVEAALYEALRASRSAKKHRGLCDEVPPEQVWIARDESISEILRKLDEDLHGGLDLVRKIVLKALAM